MCRRAKDTPDRERVEALLAGCSTRYASGIRLAAMIELLAATGLRSAELLALEPRHVDREARTVEVHDGKGGQDRTVAICRPVPRLDRWLDLRRGLGLRGRHPLFCGYSKGAEGRPVTTTYLRRALRKLGEKVGADWTVAPHSLRRYLATELLNEGKRLRSIQKQLGHKNPSTTDRYLAELVGDDAINDLIENQLPGLEG